MPAELTFREISGFRLVAADPSRLTGFYRALGFEIGAETPISAEEMHLLGLAGSGSRIAMTLGHARVDLDTFDPPGRPYPTATRACDLVFQHFALVTDDADAAWRRAKGAGATPISREGPVTLPQAAGGVTAAKLRDPEGHPLELLQFPPQAAAGWTGAGILGIDHTAISVSDVAFSRGFYERHGLALGTATLNRGPTQAALDALDGVEVNVAPMHPARKPPHLELLGYRHPAGRALGPSAPDDVAATRIVWRSDADGLIRDPDGHLHQLSR